MSLIIDALKKAQQLRSKETRRAPFFRQPSPSKRSRKKGPWILLGSSLSLLVLLLAIWKLFWMPSSRLLEPPIKIMERSVSPELSEKISLSAPKMEKSSEPAEEIPVPKSQIQLSASREEVPVKAVKPSSIQKEKFKTPAKSKELISGLPKKEQDTSPVEKASPPPSLKEEAISKPVALVRGDGKDDSLKLELIGHFNSGVSYYHRREVLKAIQSYQKVIELDPNYIEAHNNLGIIYQEAGDLERALKSYQRAIEINPHYEKALNNIGTIYLLKGEDDKASEMFRKVLSINPNHIESYIHLGTIYKKRGEMEKGIESYQKALSIDPHHGVAHYNLGLLFEQRGERERAIDHFQQFIQLCSNSYPELASKVNRHIQQLLRTKDVKKE